MGRLIPIDNLTRGMQSDSTAPGTLREAVDVLPWRGALRRRGPITRYSTGLSKLSAVLSGLGVFPATTTLKQAKCIGYYNSPFALASGSSTLTNLTTTTQLSSIAAKRWVAVGQEMIAAPLSHSGVASTVDYASRWAGSVKADYSPAVTATLTAGSKSVVFSGAITTSSVEAGMYLIIPSLQETYLITEVVDTTHVNIAVAARTTTSPTSGNWTISALGNYPCSAAGANLAMFAGTGAMAGGVANVAGGLAVCYHQGRVFFANIRERVSSTQVSTFSNRIRWSALPDETDANGFVGKENFNQAAKLDLGGEGGAIIGITSFNGALVVLRETAVQVITGAFGTSGTDLGATVNTVATGIGARGPLAWTAFEQGVAFADDKGCYVWDGEKVVNLVRGSIELLWRQVFRSSTAANIVMSAPGNKLTVQYASNLLSDSTWMVYDFTVGGWFRMRTNKGYSTIAEAGDQYLALKQNLNDDTVMVYLYDFRAVFDDLNTDYTDQALDEDGGAYPKPYILTNPIPLIDGLTDGRVEEVVINDGGSFEGYGLRVLRGPIYSGDVYSGEANLSATMSLAGVTTGVPGITGDVNQRSVKVRMDGATAASHAMVEIEHFTTTDPFALAINAIGVVVEDNPNFVSV